MTGKLQNKPGIAERSIVAGNSADEPAGGLSEFFNDLSHRTFFKRVALASVGAEGLYLALTDGVVNF